MTLKEIKQLETSYWNKKVDNLRREAREAKAVMFGEDLEVLFDNYRISESNAELTRRMQLAKPANQEDFETVINYISNYFDLDSVELNMSESVFNWSNENDIEGYFTDSVLPTMIASPNSFLTMLPREVNGLLDMELTLVDFEQVIYEDNNQFIFRVEVAEDYSKPLYGGMSTSKSDIIILNKEGGFLYTYNLELLSEITYPEAVDKYWFKLGGLKTMNLRGFFQSYFKGSIDKSVIATRIFSDKEIIRMRVGNPITIMRRLPCTACADSRGSSCSSCNGTGEVELTPSIGSVFYFNEYDLNATNKTNLNDIISYIQPPLDSVKVQREEYELHSKEVKEGLNNFYYKHSQSGVAKEVDREDKVASTEVILLRLFTLASNLLNAYSQIVTINKEIVSIVVPNELVTNGEIPIASSNIPAGELAERLLMYYKNKYKDDAVSYRLYSYAIMNDFLFPYSAAEKQTLGTPAQISFSNQLPLAIMNVEAKYKDRVRTASDKTIKKWLEEFILITETIVPIVPPIVPIAPILPIA
jgi:hypothetical protein